LPLIIFWNAATGQPQAGVDFAFGIVVRAPHSEKFIVSFLSILAHWRLEAPDCGRRAEQADKRRDGSWT
jgi:hypothetical protein